MKRFPSSCLLVLAAALTASCAFDDGRPWGAATFEVQAAFDPPEDRFDGGRIETTNGYRVELDRVEVTLEAVQLEVSSSGEAAAAFDPANPPEGYSLCHGGHCHGPDGTLVPYDEIEVPGATADFVLIQALEEEAIALGANPQAVPLESCTDECRLPQGTLTRISLDVHSLQLFGTALDAEDNRHEFDLDFDVEARLSAVVDGHVGKGEPGAVKVDLQFVLPPEVLDAIDFSQPGDATDAVREAIEREDALVVTLTQHELE